MYYFNYYRQYRFTSYRQLTRWCWGWLGRSVRVVLPSCAVRKSEILSHQKHIQDLHIQILMKIYCYFVCINDVKKKVDFYVFPLQFPYQDVHQ